MAPFILACSSGRLAVVPWPVPAESSGEEESLESSPPDGRGVSEGVDGDSGREGARKASSNLSIVSCITFKN